MTSFPGQWVKLRSPGVGVRRWNRYNCSLRQSGVRIYGSPTLRQWRFCAHNSVGRLGASRHVSVWSQSFCISLVWGTSYCEEQPLGCVIYSQNFSKSFAPTPCTLHLHTLAPYINNFLEEFKKIFYKIFCIYTPHSNILQLISTIFLKKF